MERIKEEKLSKQVKRRVEKGEEAEESEIPFEGNSDFMISTGSTLLDLAISGGRVRGGGLPGGILVEIFGPESSGKTVLLCEIAGNIQRLNGNVLFYDPEARLNRQFAQMFGLSIRPEDHLKPDKIPQVFGGVRKWKPDQKSKICGIFADSLAALSTDQEMDNEDGDKMGMRRAKEFSEELRRTCRILAQNNYLMVCSNQIRESVNVTFGTKYHSPGGKALAFYSSLRLRMMEIKKLTDKLTIANKEVERVYGIRTEIEVCKSSIWKPFRTAWVYIDYDYGIDDITANLKFIKEYTGATTYKLGVENIGRSIADAVKYIEDNNLEKKLKDQTIDLWESIERQFDSERKPKQR
jgi:recombination protein RecA